MEEISKEQHFESMLGLRERNGDDSSIHPKKSSLENARGNVRKRNLEMGRRSIGGRFVGLPMKHLFESVGCKTNERANTKNFGG